MRLMVTVKVEMTLSLGMRDIELASMISDLAAKSDLDFELTDVKSFSRDTVTLTFIAEEPSE